MKPLPFGIKKRKFTLVFKQFSSQKRLIPRNVQQKFNLLYYYFQAVDVGNQISSVIWVASVVLLY